MSEPKESPNDWLTVRQVAELKGVEESTIRKAIANDRITAFKAHPRLWLIRRRDAEHWERSSRGRTRNALAGLADYAVAEDDAGRTRNIREYAAERDISL